MRSYIRKWYNSSAVRIPAYILRTADINEGDELTITATENKIIIRKEKGHRTFSERMKGCDEKYVVEEFDTSSVGMERL
ncbi:MAG: AbrB/MazE/SpoVT family DNA-binding domain-containing protein [Methanomassiliicoccaceae archaeon]|nr:AbrB/MazE/SpoVT family DNA-binding domain-containing protein [Methanomassiliicoccaceae archaeon]